MPRKPKTLSAGQAIDKIRTLRANASFNAELARAKVMEKSKDKEKELLALLSAAEQRVVLTALDAMEPEPEGEED